MPKVTKELMQSLADAGVYPPRHKQGCAKNIARMFPMLLAAQGESVDEIKKQVREYYDKTPCTCEG